MTSQQPQPKYTIFDVVLVKQRLGGKDYNDGLITHVEITTSKRLIFWGKEKTTVWYKIYTKNSFEQSWLWYTDDKIVYKLDTRTRRPISND